jgi:hypothetical protein
MKENLRYFIKDYVHSFRIRLLKFTGIKRVCKQNEFALQNHADMRKTLRGIEEDVQMLHVVLDKVNRLLLLSKEVPAKGFIGISPLRDRGAIDRGILQSLGRRVRGLEEAFEHIIEQARLERSIHDYTDNATDAVADSDGGGNMVNTNDEQGDKQ